MKSFLEFLEKFSEALERMSKSTERKLAYVFCIMQILVSMTAAATAIGFFVYYYPKQSSTDMHVVLIVFLLVMLFMLGAYIHMIITRDLKHIRSQNPNRKEDTAKKRKIEF
jgi:cadmium resistance protein CadD (predicted permease)